MKAGGVYGRISQELGGGRPLKYIAKGAGGAPGGLGPVMASTGRTSTPTRAPTTTPAPAPAPSTGGATGVTGGSDIMDLYAAALKRLSTGGMSLEASLADIEEGKRQAIARGQQSLVSGGLAGTTVMGGVPIAAEKSAARARLGARGEAESKYLTTLASYAAFAQRAQEAAAGRSAAMDRLRMQIESQERLATESRASQERLAGEYGGGGGPWPEAPVGGPSYMASTQPSPTTPTTMVSGLGPTTQRYAQQFPSIYDEQEGSIPNWTSGGSAPGGPTYMRGAGYSEEEIARYY